MKFMDRLERLEQGIGQAVGFSKGFGTFEKADIANRIRTVMDDESYIDPNEMLMAPNIYAVNFSPADFDRIREWGNPYMRANSRSGFSVNDCTSNTSFSTFLPICM